MRGSSSGAATPSTVDTTVMNANAENAPRKTVSWLYLIPIKAAMKNVRSPTSITRITRKLRMNPFKKPVSTDFAP